MTEQQSSVQSSVLLISSYGRKKTLERPNSNDNVFSIGIGNNDVDENEASSGNNSPGD